nr:hypothetical protein [Pantoea agglomerans]
MNWIDIEYAKPSMHEMVILDTDKGVAVGCYGQFGEPTKAIFGFVGTVEHSNFVVYRWMPMPKR